MLSGDFGRSLFAALVLTALFGVVVPATSSVLLQWMGISLGGVELAVGFFVVCFLSVLLQSIVPRFRLNPKGKAVLITGCDTGFGLRLAKQLDDLGMYVFAGCLLKDKGGKGALELQRTGSNRMKVIQLDVTNDKQIEDAVRFVQLNLPEGQPGLWGIVNNAGASAFGEIEWSSIDLYKKVMDVNLWGMVRCTKAFLPQIRRSKGRVVNMASGLARMMAPSRSVYAVSKFAVGGFSDCLRYEMRRWGVKVSIIEPGNYIAGTDIFTKESVKEMSKLLWNNMPDNIKEDYGQELFDFRVNQLVGYTNAGMSDLSPVLNAYEDALLSRFPFIRYQPMESYWTIRSFIFTHFPACIADYWYIYR
ncbi:unnamed protein product [Clavelina lepadiformis]|uniref:D-beta-hydroxybutyrate dehydrogenase, mitochondrial n=1 Tax=Clavelina lepadiformis TaxID=159417 RepID=A0ABP0GHY6_CLALP